MAFDLTDRVKHVQIDEDAVRIRLVAPTMSTGDKDIHKDHPNREAMVSTALVAAANGMRLRLVSRPGSDQWIGMMQLITDIDG